MRYYKPVKSANDTYSIDMCRLYFVLKESELESIQRHFSNELRTDIEVYPTSFKNYSYRNMIKITVGDSAIIVGIGWNSTNKDDMLNGFVEFNPNKVLPEGQEELDFIHKCSWNMELKRVDVAIDINKPISHFHVEKDARMLRTYQRGNVVETIELGTHQQNLFKCYDKAKESGLSADMTRLEVTLQVGTNLLSAITKAFPTIRIDQEQKSLLLDYKNLNTTQRVLVDVLRNSDCIEQQLRLLNYKLRKKIEPFIYANMTEFKPNVGLIYNMIQEFKREFET